MKNDRIKNDRIKSDRIKSGRIKSDCIKTDRIERITDPKNISVSESLAKARIKLCFNIVEP
jgi:hypothetical protein